MDLSVVAIEYKVEKHDNLLLGSARYLAAQEPSFTAKTPKPSSSTIELTYSGSLVALMDSAYGNIMQRRVRTVLCSAFLLQ